MESRHRPLSPDSLFLPTGGPPLPASLASSHGGVRAGALRAGLSCCGREAKWGESPAGEEPQSRAWSTGGRRQERGARAAGTEGGGARSSAGSWRRPGYCPRGCRAFAGSAGACQWRAGKRWGPGAAGRRTLAGLSLAGRVATERIPTLCTLLVREGSAGTEGPKRPSGPKGACRVAVRSPGLRVDRGSPRRWPRDPGSTPSVSGALGEILRGGCCTPRPNLRHLPQVAPVAAEGSGEPSTGQVSG